MPKSSWLYDKSRTEFIRDGVGHPPVWSGNSVHGCNGDCRLPDFPGQEPRENHLAVCGAGKLGLITRNRKVKVTYPDGNEAWAWTGMTIWPIEDYGKAWSSRSPCIVGDSECFFDELLEFLIRSPNILGGTLLRAFLLDYLTRNTPDGWPIFNVSITNA